MFDSQPEYNTNDRLDYMYKDYLQAPLQPLMKNLEAFSYETIENDKMKYILYENALVQALDDFKKFGTFYHQRCEGLVEDTKENNNIVENYIKDIELKVLVVGAGRGPLARCAFNASDKTGVKIRVVALEKNKNAIVTLRNLKFSESWGDKFSVVKSDIREWQSSDVFDIIVSELLGSFGDNELSPECLDGAQRFLNKQRGIFIPYKYISYLCPINSSKLWDEVKNVTVSFPYEVPYVVKIYSAVYIGEPHPVFQFIHPKDLEISNTRYAQLEFNVNSPNLIHGFAGYFDGSLYGNIHACIVPSNHTDDLHSWFPIYFPIKDPLQVVSNDKIFVDVWRCSNSINVWYEWSIGVLNSKTSVYRTSFVHNVKGHAYSIGLHA